MGKKLLSATGHKLDFQGQLIARNQDLFLHGNYRYFGGNSGSRTMAAKTGYLLEGVYNYENYLTDGTTSNRGAVFVFSDNGSYLGKIDNPNSNGTETSDTFGYSMRFRIDGNRLIIAALNEDPLSGSNQGVAYLYDTSDSNWENWTLLNAYAMPNHYSTTTSDTLGSVAVSDDYVIGGHRYEDNASYTNVGVVHVFNANSPYEYIRTIQNPNMGNSDYFGWDVDIYGSTAIIGSPRDDYNGTDAGRAYLYNVNTGSLIASLYNYEHSNEREYGYFGEAVSINSSRAVVAAKGQGDYVYPSYVDAIGYLYSYTHSGSLQTQITMTSTGGAYHGYSFDLSAGGLLVIGNSNSNMSVYRYNTSGGYYGSSSNPNVNTKASGDYYGRTVAIQRDSTSTSSYKWYVAAPYEHANNAFRQGVIYRYQGDSYSGYISPPEDGILQGDTRENDPFLGRVVSLNERYAAASAYQAYDYLDDNSDSIQSYSGIVNIYDARNNFEKIRTVRNFNIYSSKNSDNFGWCLAIQKDGDLLAITSQYEDSALYTNLGVVYVYDIATDTLQRVFQNPNPDTTSATDNFGAGRSGANGTAIDDTYIAIGAYYEEYGSYSNAGRVYIYNHTNGLNQINLVSPNAQASGAFGCALDMVGDIIAVGADYEGANSGDGRVYIFNKLTGALLATIDNPNIAITFGDRFGVSVKISPNGNYMAVGAYAEDFNYSNSGSLYLYDISNPSSPVQLWRADGDGSYNYGYNIGLSDYHVVTGAVAYDGANTDSGKAVVYDIDGTLLQTLYPTNPYNQTYDPYNNYGRDVAVNNNGNVVVGEPATRKHVHEDDYGAVYFYR